MRDYDLRISIYASTRGNERATISLGNEPLRRKYSGKRMSVIFEKDRIIFKSDPNGYKVTKVGVLSIESSVNRFKGHEGIYPRHIEENSFYVLYRERQEDSVASPFSKLGSHVIMPTSENGRQTSDRKGKAPELKDTTGYLKINDNKAFRALFAPLVRDFTPHIISKVTGVNEGAVDEFIDNLNNTGTGWVSEELIIGILSHFYSGNTYAEYLKVFDTDYEKRSKFTKKLYYYRHTKGYNLENTKELIKEEAGHNDNFKKIEKADELPLTARVDDIQRALEPNVMPNGFVWVIDKHFSKDVRIVDKHAYIDMKTFLNALSYLPNISGDVTAKVIEDFFIPKKEETDLDKILDTIKAINEDNVSWLRTLGTDTNSLKDTVRGMMPKLDMIGSIQNMAENMAIMTKTMSLIEQRLEALEKPAAVRTLRLVKKSEPALSDKDWKIKIREDIKKATEAYRKEHRGVPYGDSDVFNAVYSEMNITNNARKTLAKKWKEETGKNNPSLLDLIAIDKDLRKNFEEILERKKVG